MVRKVQISEFHGALRLQGIPERQHLVFICPMCGTAQSAADLIAAGAGDSFDEVETYVGFSCVGRWTNAGSPRKKPDGNACNWTLSGLFQTHTYAVITEDGQSNPLFEPASPIVAQAHYTARSTST